MNVTGISYLKLNMLESKFNKIIANIFGNLKELWDDSVLPKGSISGSLNGSFFWCELWSVTTKLWS